MATKVIMPALGMSQDNGTLLKWLKKEGEKVIKGEPLMEIETDKATVEVEAPATGILAKVTASEGDVIPVAQIMALILMEGETERNSQGSPVIQAVPSSVQNRVTNIALHFGSDSSEEASKLKNYVTVSPLAMRIAESNNIDLKFVKPEGGKIDKADLLVYLQNQEEKKSVVLDLPRIPASPKARRLAFELGIDLRTVHGTGPEGAVLTDDVLVFKEATMVENITQLSQATTKLHLEEQHLPKIWRSMGERTTKSWTSVPHFYLQREVNATRFMEWRKHTQTFCQKKITFTDLLVKVTSAALAQIPRINAIWRDGKIFTVSEISIGVAMAIEDGLIVPVIHRADELSLEEIAQRREDLYQLARDGKIQQEDLEGGTFTISNLGMYGVDTFNAILNTPQIALLAVGRIAERVVAVNGQPTVQPMMTLSLSCDHRAIDGVRGSEFLSKVAGFIEEPLNLLST